MDAPSPGSSPVPPTSHLTLTHDLWEQMRRHVAELAPEEACGLVAGQAGQGLQVFPITNQLHSPVRFHMVPEEQLRAFVQMDKQGLELVAIYHSHPGGSGRPSITDVAEAYYPEAIYLVWSPDLVGWICQGFTILGGIVRDVEVNITGLE